MAMLARAARGASAKYVLKIHVLNVIVSTNCFYVILFQLNVLYFEQFLR
jgi:hypothetical protein